MQHAIRSKVNRLFTLRLPLVAVVLVGVFMIGGMFHPKVAFASSTVAWPVNVQTQEWNIIQGYNHGDHVNSQLYGFDLQRQDGSTVGAQVKSPVNGTVESSTVSATDGYGVCEFVDVDGYTSPTLEVSLCHLSVNSSLLGQHVTQGTVLGTIVHDAAGGDHLHFNLRDQSGGSFTPVKFSDSQSGFSIQGCNYSSDGSSNQYTGTVQCLKPGGWWIGPTPSDFTDQSSGSTLQINFRMNDNNNGGLDHGDITYWSSGHSWQKVSSSHVTTTFYQNGTADVYTTLTMPNAPFEVSVNVYSKNGAYQLAPSGIRHFCPSGSCSASNFPSGGSSSGGGGGLDLNVSVFAYGCMTNVVSWQLLGGTADSYVIKRGNLQIGTTSGSATQFVETLPTWNGGDISYEVDAISGGSVAALTVDPFSYPQCTPSTQNGTTIYDEGLASGWSDWSWNSTNNFSDTAHPYTGSQDISWTANAGYAALYLHKSGGIDTTPYSALTFSVRATQAGQAIQVLLYDSSDNVIGSALPLTNYGGDPSVGSYKTYSIPLAFLGGSGRTIDGIVIQDATGNSQPAMYVDDVALQGFASTVYDESLSSGWSDWSWNSTNNFSDTANPGTGSKDISWTATAGYGGLYLHDAGFNTAGYTFLTFTLQASQSGQSAQVQLHDANDNAIGNPVPLTNYGGDPIAGGYTEYAIPLAALGGWNRTINGLVIEDKTGSAQPAMYVDDIMFQ